MLRAKKPEAISKRFKAFMFGPAGVGKTTASVQFPNSYIIDAERGTENYDKLINASGSSVFHTTDINEVVTEVKALLTEKHNFRTLVIDPITPLFNGLLDQCANEVGESHGRHYGAANKTMKRLANLILRLDMNVIVTAHAKTEYGPNLTKLGYTFDGWKQLDYWFDLVVELSKKGKKRFGKVVKTRIETFPDEDVFEWSYDAIKSRYDAATIERQASTTQFATPAQLKEFKRMTAAVTVPQSLIDKWMAKLQIDNWEDCPSDAIQKCIEYMEGKADSNGEMKALADRF